MFFLLPWNGLADVHVWLWSDEHTQKNMPKCPFRLVFYPSCRSRKSKLFIQMFIILFISVLFSFQRTSESNDLPSQADK